MNIKPKQKYLSEYKWFQTIPNDEWLLFVGLKYRKPRYKNKYIFHDVRQWIESLSRTINLKSDQLVWFGRIENKEENRKQTVPRHVHLCIHKQHLKSRFRNTDKTLWTVDTLIPFLKRRWEQFHGKDCCSIEEYEPQYSNPTGVGYCLKNKSSVEDVFISKGLVKLLKSKEVSR